MIEPTFFDVDELTPIAEMAEQFGITTRALRFYEAKGLIQPVRIGNRRHYTSACKDQLRVVLIGKSIGLELCAIPEFIGAIGRANFAEDETSEVTAILADQIKALKEMEKDLQRKIQSGRDLISRFHETGHLY